nr:MULTISPECIES: TlpA disulfide reductase family protein [Myxococcaceae]
MLALASCAHSPEQKKPVPVEAAEKGKGTPLELHLQRFPGGEPWSLEGERGSVVLLDVWATWCMPCRDTLPVYTELQRLYGERGLKVYAFNVDEDPRAIQPFLDEFHVNVPVLVGKDAGVAEQVLGLGVLPTAYLIDRSGVVRKKHESAVGDTGSLLRQYRTEIEALLAEPQPEG